MVKLKLISTSRLPNTFGDYNNTAIYGNDLYKLTTDIIYKGTNGDESWMNEGTIKIESKDRQVLIRKFVGECGC